MCFFIKYFSDIDIDKYINCLAYDMQHIIEIKTWHKICCIAKQYLRTMKNIKTTYLWMFMILKRVWNDRRLFVLMVMLCLVFAPHSGVCAGDRLRIKR